MQVGELIKALEEVEDKEQKILVLNGEGSYVIGTHIPEEVCGLKNKGFEIDLTLTEEKEVYLVKDILDMLTDDCINVKELIEDLKKHDKECFVHVPHSVISHVVDEVVDMNDEVVPNAIGIVSLLHCL